MTRFYSERMDVDTNAFFARELEHVKAQTYDIVYPDLKARMAVPVSSEVNNGATTVTYQQFDRTGQAKIVANNARDLPRAEVNGVEFTRPVRTVGAMYAYTLKEIRASMMAQRGLVARKADVARRMIEETMDEIAAVGAPSFGISTGFVNDANVPDQSVPNGGGGNPEWSTKTADEIITDISAAYQRVISASIETIIPNMIVLPPEQWALIHTLPRATVSDTTVADFVRRTFGVEIMAWNRTEGAGTGSSDRMVMYRRDPMILQQEIVSEFEQLPVQEVGLEFQIPCIGETAGSVFYYPLGADYSDDI